MIASLYAMALLILMFYRIFLYTPRIFFWWLVGGILSSILSRGYSYSLIYHRRGWTPRRLCTQAVCRRSTRKTFNPKESKTLTPSTTHYPQSKMKVFGRILRSNSNRRHSNGSLAEWIRAFLTI